MNVKYYTEKDMEKARKDGAKDGFDVMTMMFVWGLYEVENMPKERIQKLIDFVEEKCKFVVAKEFNFSDVQKMLKDEINIFVDFDKERVK